LPTQILALPVGNHEIRLGRREAHVAVRQDDGARYILSYTMPKSTRSDCAA
jgi:hypothetical protein